MFVPRLKELSRGNEAGNHAQSHRVLDGAPKALATLVRGRRYTTVALRTIAQNGLIAHWCPSDSAQRISLGGEMSVAINHRSALTSLNSGRRFALKLQVAPWAR